VVASALFLGQEGDAAVADRAVETELPPLSLTSTTVPTESGWLVGRRLTLADISVVTGFANLRYAGCTVERKKAGPHYPPKAAGVRRLRC